MSEQIIKNPYARIEQLERALKSIATWARVDIKNQHSPTGQRMHPCLLAKDVEKLIDKVLG